MNCPNVVSVFYVKQKYGLNSNASDTGTSIALPYFSICSIVVCLIFGYFCYFKEVTKMSNNESDKNISFSLPYTNPRRIKC